MKRYLDCLRLKKDMAAHLQLDLQRLLAGLSPLSNFSHSKETSAEHVDAANLFSRTGRKPTLGVILWQHDEAGKYFVSKKLEYLRQLNMDAVVQEIQQGTDCEKVIEITRSVSLRSDIDAVLLQQPADGRPVGFSESLDFITQVGKDVDGTNSKCHIFRNWIEHGVNSVSADYYYPDSGTLPIPALIMHELICDRQQCITALDPTKVILVIGADQVTAAPSLEYFLSLRSQLTHREQKNVSDPNFLKLHNIHWLKSSEDILLNQSLVNSASIVVMCLNQPEVLDVHQLKSLKVAFDFGYGTVGEGNQIRGDLKRLPLDTKMETPAIDTWITPVPGGVGALISSGLARNLYVAWKRNLKLS